ncbi:MAG: acyltransferase 3 [Deltaproteobacteria bacterium]|nr:acyltransferase 3 [Deltaproteobacteria bacterium]
MTHRFPSAPDRFYSLDVLRGLAALSVIFWHWQHFFFRGTIAAMPDISRLPMSRWAFTFYTHGWLAVDFFFILSGFVFYWLYSKRVAEGGITPRAFAWLRFSRLYPLHFATLLFVAVSQRWLLRTQGSYFVYPNNDARHFLLNLLFASSWGVERGYSFNGPIWSVSVEVLLYALFFAFCRLLPIRALVLALISITGFVLVTRYYDPVGRGVGCFFLGGLVFFAYKRVAASAHAFSVTKWAACLTTVAWLITFIVASGSSMPSFGRAPFLVRLDPYVQWALPTVFSHWPTKILFPATVFSLALIETHRGSLGRCVSFLGDISYAVYLLHFPLQLWFAAVVSQFGINHTIYYSPWFMALFFAVLIVFSLGSYRYFEAPSQRFLRRWDIIRCCRDMK